MIPSRNEPCGSGRKWKHCHGAPRVQADFARAIEEDYRRSIRTGRGSMRAMQVAAMAAALVHSKER